MGFIKWIICIGLAFYAICVAVDHNELRELMRQKTILSIEVLELELELLNKDTK